MVFDITRPSASRAYAHIPEVINQFTRRASAQLLGLALEQGHRFELSIQRLCFCYSVDRRELLFSDAVILFGIILASVRR
jgi:hypothetical protein